jgi:hypothetical protein
MEGINIKSSTIEKSLELAKGFLNTLLGPTIEETGLLIGDNIKYIRFKNQIKILNKARNYALNKKIKTSEISLKILVPLLENASLEESPDLQSKWASMIVSMADSETNLQNQIFPFILGQLSITEFNELDKLSKYEKQHIKDYAHLNSLQQNTNDHKTDEERDVLKKIKAVNQEGFLVALEQFEISNLLRLGLIEALPKAINIEQFKSGGFHNSSGSWHNLKAEYDDLIPGYRISELGVKFLEICTFK